MENLYKNVEKYLKKSAKINKGRQVMATIQHNNGKQVISNGFGLVVFDEWCADLELLPTTSEDLSLNLVAFIPQKCKFESLQECEKVALNGLKTYIKEYKQQEFYQKGEPIFIWFGNKILNAEFLRDIIETMQNVENMQVFNDENEQKGIVLKNAKTTAMLLPCRKASFNAEFLTKIEKFKNKILGV